MLPGEKPSLNGGVTVLTCISFRVFFPFENQLLLVTVLSIVTVYVFAQQRRGEEFAGVDPYMKISEAVSTVTILFILSYFAWFLVFRAVVQKLKGGHFFFFL